MKDLLTLIFWVSVLCLIFAPKEFGTFIRAIKDHFVMGYTQTQEVNLKVPKE
jgi:hypothetical protein